MRGATVLLLLLSVGCEARELRGTTPRSADGQTRLAIEDACQHSGQQSAAGTGSRTKSASGSVASSPWAQTMWSYVDHWITVTQDGKADWQELKRRVSQLLGQGGVDPKRVDHHEKVTRHDVIAFTTAVAEKVGPVARYIHFGLTSSDVVDTALSLMILEDGPLFIADTAVNPVPTPEHFDPVFVVLGSARSGERPSTIYEGFRYGTLSLRSFALASP